MVRYNDPCVVYVNPMNMSKTHFELYLAHTMELLEQGTLPAFLVSIMPLFYKHYLTRSKLVPLFRHSTLPELQRFVGIFKPERVVPNFLEPKLHGIDWSCMPIMFGPYMSPGGDIRIREEMVASVPIDSFSSIDLDDTLEDVERSNLEGGNDTTDLDVLADKWAPLLDSDRGLARIGRKIERLKNFLPKGVGVLVTRLMRNAASKALPDYYQKEEENDNESSDGEDDGGAMAEWLFMTSQDGRRELATDEDTNANISRDVGISRAKAKVSLAHTVKPASPIPTEYPSPRSQERSRVLMEQTNVVKAEMTIFEGTIRQEKDKEHSQSRSQSQDTNSQARAKYEHEAELAQLEKVLREREQMKFDVKTELLSPPPTLKRLGSPIESQTIKCSCPKSSVSRGRPSSNSLGIEASTQPTPTPERPLAKSQNVSISSHSRDRPSLFVPLRKPSSSEPPDTRFRRKVPNPNDEMDWERARALEQLYICELRAGRKPKMPELNCTAGRWGCWTRF